MTVIATFQGDNCMLLASDLMLERAENYPTLPRESGDTFISLKFRKRIDGDYIAFRGNLFQNEAILLHRLLLKHLREIPIKDHPLVRREDKFYWKEGDPNWKRSDDDLFKVYYGAVNDARLYVGSFHRPLASVERGKPYADGGPEQTKTLEDITLKLCSGVGRYDVDFLRELSKQYEEYLIEAEKNKTYFGGYSSFIVTPGKIILDKKNLGKLEGLQEIEIDLNGMLKVVNYTNS